MDNRRTFLKKSVLAAAGISLGSSIFNDGAKAASGQKRISILHTNDMHSRIEAFPDDGGRYANMGGMAKRATLINQIRQAGENILLLDAGDIFQGTPYFNFYNGELEFKLMSKMGYDAATLGNHDFDNGMEGLLDQIPNAEFQFVSSNYDFKGTVLEGLFLPYKIYKKAGIKVGVFGLGIELEGLVAKANFGNTKYLDPVSTAREMVEELKSKGCHLIICLSHLGYSYKTKKIDDLKLASQVDGIDLLIGGHTHTFLDQPTEIPSPGGHITLVNQVGWSGLQLGKVDFDFDKEKKIKSVVTGRLAIK